MASSFTNQDSRTALLPPGRKGRRHILRRTPPQIFTLVSILFLGLTIAGTGFVLSIFFRDSLITREGSLIAEFAHALSSRDLSLEDWQVPTPDSQRRLGVAFTPIVGLTDVLRVKVFSAEGRVLWSDHPALVDTEGVRIRAIAAAAAGSKTALFYHQTDEASAARNHYDPVDAIEFYVPIRFTLAEGQTDVVGVLALYREISSLDATISRGVWMVWAVAVIAGVGLYLGLFTLFRRAWRRQHEAEHRLTRLSSEHARIVQLEKLSAMGTMVGEIAHQINNPLVGVLNLAQLAERKADDPKAVRSLLGDIQQAGEHCRAFVQRMLAYAKLAELQRQPTDLCRLVTETVALFRQSSGPGVETMVSLPGKPVVLSVDPVLVRHALFNLLTNAAQVSDGTAIAVALSEQGQGWALSVRDRGPGVAEDEAEKLFTPFYSTRSGGVGLGLSVVHHIATQHNGTIVVENINPGARFTLWFPEDSSEAENR